MTVTVEPPPVEALDAGVIEDARARQRRYRRAGAGALVALALAGVVAYLVVEGGGGAANADGNAAAVPRASGSVQFVSLRTPGLGLFTGPNLAGQASLCLSAVYDGGGSESCGLYPLPQAGLPLEDASGYQRPSNASGRVRAGGVVYMLLAAPDVAAVRVGGLGTVRVQDAPGLPPGDHAVAFRETAGSIGTVVPPGASVSWIRRFAHLRDSPAIVLTALDRSGHALPFRITGALKQFFPGLTGVASNPPAHNKTTSTAKSRCGVAEHLPGLTLQLVSGLTNIAAEPYAGPGALLSCLWETYGFQGKRFQVAVLLNADTPGTRPGPMWDAQPLPGHSGIVAVMDAPSTADNAIVARRVGDAWLVAAPWVGYAGYPTLSQRLEVLAALHITRVNLSSG
jgi:hypothetical protein